MSVSPIIKYRTLAIAKNLAPVDTGNLRHNAISLKVVKANSWTIYYDKTQADYLEFLEEGWVGRSGAFHDQNRRFIKKTSKTIAQYLYNELSGKPTSRWYGRSTLRNVLSTAEDSEDRRIRNFNSRTKYFGEVR